MKILHLAVMSVALFGIMRPAYAESRLGQVVQGVSAANDLSTALTGKDAVSAGIDAVDRGVDAIMEPSPSAPAAELDRVVPAIIPSAIPTTRDCASCPDMVLVPAGSFVMGAEDGDADERPVHTVTIAYGLAVSRTEISFAQWDRCVAEGGCPPAQGTEGWGRGAMPVMHVSWNDAQTYVKWLSAKTGKAYRLPSEAEWEYLARGGTQTRYWWGENPGQQANCRGCGIGFGNKPVDVGVLPENPFGLKDVLGNLQEWVEDCSTISYYGAPMDGSPVLIGDCRQRMLRGGSWQVGPSLIRVSTRFRLDPSFQSDQVGFRVVRSVE